MKKCLFLNILICACFVAVAQTTWQVGANRTYTQPSQVINLVNNGDVVEIDAGEYLGDVGAWYADNITIRGIGGKAHLRANGNYSQGKAIWVIGGDNYLIENIELSECTVPDENGAGIRLEGTNLTIRHCYFHDNENGILAGDNANSNILIEYSEFARNSHPSGFAHNIYINHVENLTVQYSYFHGAVGGHNLKSRAAETYILYNRIMDESDGASSYVVDIPDGGKAYLVGNVLQQGQNAENSSAIAYGKENPSTYATNEFNFYNNTLVNERGNGYFFTFHNSVSPSVVRIFNNLLAGEVFSISSGSVTIDLNKNKHFPTIIDAGLMDYENYDYQLLNISSAIDMGILPASEGAEIPVDMQYVHPFSVEHRPTNNAIDMGAYEFGMTTSLATEQLDFSTTLVDDVVQIQWTTNFHQPIQFIAVEKAILTTDFQIFNKITNPNYFYQFKDAAVTAGETYYYRLKISFENGVIQYSDIETISFDKKPRLTTFPNPVNDILYINWTTPTTGNIRLFDVKGKIVKEIKVKEKQELAIDVRFLPKGLYFLKQENGDDSEVYKILVE